MPNHSYEIIRTGRRKTASVSVSPYNKVTITTPDNLSNEEIEAIIKRKDKWIRGKIEFNKQVKYPYKTKEYISGESFTYLGRNYRLKVQNGTNSNIKLKGKYLLINIEKSLGDNQQTQYIKDQLIEWYKDKAYLKCKERMALYSNRIEIQPSEIKIKDLKSRWGSCSQKGALNFNWKIIMAPMRIVDYVIVHELCHLRYHDHSPDFWKQIGLLIRDFKDKKEWLRVHGALLNII